MCKNIIDHWAENAAHKFLWHDAMETDVVPALFGVLVCSLPNLKELRLGEGWLLDFPVFSRLLSAEAQAYSYWPRNWDHRYLSSALEAIAEKLEVLEVPADMTAFYTSRAVPTIFDYRRFPKLRELGVTMKSLTGYASRPQQLDELRDVFPRSLEVLRISEATHYTAEFLAPLCMAKHRGRYPALHRVEVYHTLPLSRTEEVAYVWRYKSMEASIQDFRNGEIALYLYFPAWQLMTWNVGRTPWRLRKEAAALDIAEHGAYQKALGAFGRPEQRHRPFEGEWDAEGDVVMLRDLARERDPEYRAWWDHAIF